MDLRRGCGKLPKPFPDGGPQYIALHRGRAAIKMCIFVGFFHQLLWFMKFKNQVIDGSIMQRKVSLTCQNTFQATRCH